MKLVHASTTLLFATTAAAQYADMPESRFTQWGSLSTANLAAATALAYDEDSWAFLLENDIELVSYEENVAAVTDFVTHVTTLDIDEDQWDCWISHFESYDWSEIAADADLLEAWEALGWTMELWEGDGLTLPDSEDKFWVDLTSVSVGGEMTELEAAEYLCYNEEIWNEENSINEWGSVVEEPCSNIFCQIFFFFFNIFFWWL